jgi:exopolyphosphatase/guanosine-5'-triphosphate,3'-diphosphate pyrophosphatase
MVPVAPRWEWRTFGTQFGAVAARLRARASRPRSSAETYVVCERADVNIKIRDRLIDVKTLQQVDARGLEVWQPIMTAAFPLDAAAIDTLRHIWNLPPVPVERATSVAQFLDEIVRPQRKLTAVEVTKRRYGVTIDECLVEVADLTFDGLPIETLAVEMTDPDRVWQTVHALGLAAFDNVNYVQALRRFLTVHTR